MSGFQREAKRKTTHLGAFCQASNTPFFHAALTDGCGPLHHKSLSDAWLGFRHNVKSKLQLREEARCHPGVRVRGPREQQAKLQEWPKMEGCTMNYSCTNSTQTTVQGRHGSFQKTWQRHSSFGCHSSWDRASEHGTPNKRDVAVRGVTSRGMASAARFLSGPEPVSSPPLPQIPELCVVIRCLRLSESPYPSQIRRHCSACRIPKRGYPIPPKSADIVRRVGYLSFKRG